MVWSKTKKQLESFLCSSLKDRVGFHCSNYRMHDGIGRAYITVDGKEVFNMCTLKRDYYNQPKEGLYSQVEFFEAVHEYLNSPIEVSLESKGVIARILVLLDRCIGKRSLENMKNKILSEDEVMQYFYRLRCETRD